MSAPPVPHRSEVLAEKGLISRDWTRYFIAISDAITGAIEGASLLVTGAIQGASVVASGDITAARFFRTDYAAAQGEWTDVPFNAANFTASGAMTWTVDSGDQVTFAYTLVGKTMIVTARLAPTSVGGVVGPQLLIAIPGGFVAAKVMGTAFVYLDNGVVGAGFCRVAASGTTIALFTDVTTTTNWTLSANNTSIAMQLSFEVQ